MHPLGVPMKDVEMQCCNHGITQCVLLKQCAGTGSGVIPGTPLIEIESDIAFWIVLFEDSLLRRNVVLNPQCPPQCRDPLVFFEIRRAPFGSPDSRWCRVIVMADAVDVGIDL